VIEDGSKRCCCGYCKALLTGWMLILCKTKRRAGFTRNYGFERAKGDYFIIFDSDCLIPEDYLQIVNEFAYS